MRYIRKVKGRLEEPVKIGEIDWEMPSGIYTLEWGDGDYEIMYENGWRLYAEPDSQVAPSDLVDEDVGSENDELDEVSAEAFREIWQEIKTAKNVSEGDYWQTRRIG